MDFVILQERNRLVTLSIVFKLHNSSLIAKRSILPGIQYYIRLTAKDRKLYLEYQWPTKMLQFTVETIERPQQYHTGTSLINHA